MNSEKEFRQLQEAYDAARHELWELKQAAKKQNDRQWSIMFWGIIILVGCVIVGSIISDFFKSPEELAGDAVRRLEELDSRSFR